MSHVCHISQHTTVTDCKWEKKTNLLLPSSRKEGNLHFKIAAHSHHTELMDFLYWFMGSQLIQMWYKKNLMTLCGRILKHPVKLSANFSRGNGAETGWQFREHTDFWKNRRRMRRKPSQQLFVSFRTNHLEKLYDRDFYISSSLSHLSPIVAMQNILELSMGACSLKRALMAPQLSCV